jgi:amino acid transporter
MSGWSVFLKNQWATDDFVTNYLPLALFPVLYIIAKFIYRDPYKKAHEMDFVSDIKEIEAAT